ncbi:MAG: LamG domain-containing protein, partial [Victivallales bacterium]|nr:LamG domain-containing protein [Victivallales bacterium]
GYRLGFAQGCPAWQVPKAKWSHSLVGPEELPVGAWTHLAATFDNRMMRLYVNGKQVGELARAGLVHLGNGDINLGSYGGSRACFQGGMDDVRVHNRPLTAAEIVKLAASAH